MDPIVLLIGSKGKHVNIEPVTTSGKDSVVYGTPVVAASIDGKITLTRIDDLNFIITDAGQTLPPGGKDECDVSITAEGDPVAGVDTLTASVHVIVQNEEASSLKLNVSDVA